MASYLPSVGQSKSFNVHMSNYRRNELSLEQLCEDKMPFVTVVVPQMKNGNLNHAFCVIDDLIFDSTQSYAMKLIKESTEWICKPNYGFERIKAAYHFQQKFHTKENWTPPMKKHW